VDKKTDVSFGQCGDLADFAIGEVVEKFKPDDFALIMGESFEDFDEVAVGFALFGNHGRTGFRGKLPRVVGFIERVHAVLLSEDVEAAVAADGVKPGFEFMFHVLPGLMAELEKGVLDDIAGAVGIAQKFPGIGQEEAFILGDGLLDPGLAGRGG
jgi:hypothetical protein